MKKILFFIFLIVALIIAIIIYNIYNFNNISIDAKKFNNDYLLYNKHDVQGVDVITLINRAMNNNEKHGILLDEKSRYVEDDEYSIKIQIRMKSNETTYDMEQIYKLGAEKFIANFGETMFNCIEVKYHNKTGRISKMVFESVE